MANYIEVYLNGNAQGYVQKITKNGYTTTYDISKAKRYRSEAVLQDDCDTLTWLGALQGNTVVGIWAELP